MQTTITIHVHGPAATAIRFVPNADSFRAPLPAGFAFGQIQVDPAGWTGDVTASGDDVTVIGVDQQLHLVALADILAARDFVVTVTATE